LLILYLRSTMFGITIYLGKIKKMQNRVNFHSYVINFQLFRVTFYYTNFESLWCVTNAYFLKSQIKKFGSIFLFKKWNKINFSMFFHSYVRFFGSTLCAHFFESGLLLSQSSSRELLFEEPVINFMKRLIYLLCSAEKNIL